LGAPADSRGQSSGDSEPFPGPEGRPERRRVVFADSDAESGSNAALRVDQGRKPHTLGSPKRIRVEVPGKLRTGRWVPSRRAGLGMVLLVVLVSAILGVRVAWAMANDEALPLVSGARASLGAGGRESASGDVGADGVSPGPGSVSASAKAAASGSPSGAGPGAIGTGQVGVVVVHVVGAVNKPGLVQLAAGSRVADAIAAAGGSTAEADLASINVARLLVDGEQIRVPLPGEVIGPALGGPATGGSGGSGASGGTAGGSAGGGRLVSLNSADLTALDSLPGVGPVLAQRILDWRTAHGRFTSVDELGEVTGIGEKLLSQIKPLVSL